MRSELVVLNSKCSLKNDCNLCDKLGYRSYKKVSDPFGKLNHVLSAGVTSRALLPCSTSELKDFESLVTKNQDSISHVLLFRMWFSLSPVKKELLLRSDVALVFDNYSDLVNSDLPKKAKLYFAITPENWKGSQWAELPGNLKDRLNFFFPANPYDQKELFDSRRLYEIVATVRALIPAANFSTPFGHDLIDTRNVDHLNWIFSEDDSFERLVSKKVPKISIIIPTYNRTEFLLKIVRTLEDQSLNKEDFELIIVDDGSSDSSDLHLKYYLKNNPKISVRYFYVNRDIGVQTLYNSNRAGPIRNLGVRKSRGEILLFLDSDILVPESYLEEILELHKTHDVVSPRRVYLSKEASSRADFSPSKFSDEDRMQTNWQDYLQDFHSTDNWAGLTDAWKYFMTYCLSVKRDLFLASAGFRTNFISYGYEDLDWGYRIVQLGARLKFYNRNVFHLYHFDGGSEYTLSTDFRFFQLAMSSRVFVAQNFPIEANYLLGMTDLKNPAQEKYFQRYSFLWKSFNFLRKVQWTSRL